MVGSILGDIAGSVYEFHNIKTKEFPFLTPQKGYTDDSILTLATADWLLHGGDCATYYFRYATRYPCPLGGFGGRFREWLRQGQQTGQAETVSTYYSSIYFRLRLEVFGTG